MAMYSFSVVDANALFFSGPRPCPSADRCSGSMLTGV
jgi:hypothetical protein